MESSLVLFCSNQVHYDVPPLYSRRHNSPSPLAPLPPVQCWCVFLAFLSNPNRPGTPALPSVHFSTLQGGRGKSYVAGCTPATDITPRGIFYPRHTHSPYSYLRNPNSYLQESQFVIIKTPIRNCKNPNSYLRPRGAKLYVFLRNVFVYVG